MGEIYSTILSLVPEHFILQYQGSLIVYFSWLISRRLTSSFFDNKIPAAAEYFRLQRQPQFIDEIFFEK